MAPRYVLPALLILCMQVALYLWMAPRGFEFTDESYYLHNFLYWREFTGTVTFFGAYFEWPFRLSGASIAAMRVLSLLLVLASAALLARQVMLFGWEEPGAPRGIRQQFWYMVAPMAAAMLFFGFLSTLRAPSYNLLCLVAMALMTACMLSVLGRRAAGQSTAAMAFLYGLALGACFLSKATTAVSVTVLHLGFFLVLNRDWAWRWLLTVLAMVTAGFVLNFVVLTMSFPGWLEMLKEGIAITRVRDGSYSMWMVLNGLRWSLQKQLPSAAPWLLGGALLLFLARRKIALASPSTRSFLVVALIAAVSFSHVYEGWSRLWLIITACVAASLWFVERLACGDRLAGYDLRRERALTVLLLLSPLAFSFGTNMPLLAHSAIASLFASIAICLRLYRLGAARAITGPALAIALALLCAPALLTQWLAWTDVLHTYRQVAPLAQQDALRMLGTEGSVVRVDQATARSLQALQQMARNAGMPAGQDMLDMTGDSPGVIYALGARPLGSPWMLGGYPGSSAAIERILEKVDTQRVRGAWLLTSPDKSRRARDWPAIMARRIGPATHQLAATVEIVNPVSASPGEPATVHLQLWKPAMPDGRVVASPAAGAGSNGGGKGL
jgi:hypothetical protein